MKRSLLRINNALFLALLTSAVLWGCAPAGEQKEEATTTQDSIVIPPPPDTVAAAQKPADTPVKTVTATVQHQTIKKEGREIKHGSDNDKLLDSIKAAKNKQKGIK